jgi:hypothetical protein
MAQVHIQNPNDPTDVKVFEQPPIEDMSEEDFFSRVKGMFGMGEAPPMSDSGVPLPPRKPDAPTVESPENFSLIPTNLKMMVKDLAGSKSIITHENFQPSELKSIEALIKAKGSPEGSISYKDYEDKYEGVKFRGDSEADKKSFKDPAYRVKTTLGQFSYRQDEEGNTIVVDEYDFNDAKQLQEQNPSITDKLSNFIDYAKESDVNNYGLVRRFMSLFGSAEGEGAKVEINLGKVFKAMNPVSDAHASESGEPPSLKTIQSALGVKADGIMGPKTLEAIKSFQKSRGLKVDGIVGPKTLAALNRPS